MYTDLLPRFTVKSGPKAPTEKAPLGLHYFVATNEYIVPADIERMLWEMFRADQQTQFAGPRASSRSETLAKFAHVNLKPLNARERDELCDLGYNPICIVHPFGPVVWGNYISESSYDMPEILALVRVLNYTLSILVDIVQAQQGELPGMISHFLIYVYRRLHVMMNNLICERLVDDGSVTVEGTRLYVRLTNRRFKFVTEFSFDQDDPFKWALNSANDVIKPVLLELYPHLFTLNAYGNLNFTDVASIHESRS